MLAGDTVSTSVLAGDTVSTALLPRGDGTDDGSDGALFRYLACSKQSVVIDPTLDADRALLNRLLCAAHGVVWSPGGAVADDPAWSPTEIRSLAPGATVLSLTPFGLEGPWAQRPANDATLQALSGGAAQRGSLETPPLIVGGSLGDFEAGLVATVSYLIARHRRVNADGGEGIGELIDVSALESQCLTMTMYPVTFNSIAGVPMRLVRSTNLPGVHASQDGYVGFMVVTGQQWLDFAAMVEQPDWANDPDLGRFKVRSERRGELLPAIDVWMAQRTSQEIAEYASLLRIPVAILGNGESLPLADHIIEHEWYIDNPGGGFIQPRVPYALGAHATTRPFETPPTLGAHTSSIRDEQFPMRRAQQVAPSGSPGLPLTGLRVLDFCNNWAGPIIGQILAVFGADVLKVESTQKPDPLRFNTIQPMSHERYWEWSPLQHGPNTAKRDVTLDMASERGRELALELVAHSDIVLENYSPRVMDSWGLTAQAIATANPAAVYLRAPAYGLHGPWRDRVGYAQTIEMTAGLAWLTGLPDQPPEIPNGPCDPIAGLHATIAVLLGLEHRRRSGEGMTVESPMVSGALNVAAEQVIEFSASGELMQRIGNRNHAHAPQGMYRTNDDDLPFGQGRWVMISVESNRQWHTLKQAVAACDSLFDDAGLDTVNGRQLAHDHIDKVLSQWCATLAADDVVEQLAALGVPAAKVMLPHEQDHLEQLLARGWFTKVNHPVVGPTTHGGFPALFEHGPSAQELHRSPSPTLGQHNYEILHGLLGLADDELATLTSQGVIGTTVGGGSAW